MLRRFNDIQEYTNWTETVWYCATDSGNNNLAVMALGLSGEMAEVLEQCQSDSLSLYEMEKELGDLIYYWARLHCYFQIESQSHFSEALHLAEENRCQSHSQILLHLSEHCGHCCDILKKCIRDSQFDFLNFKHHITQVMAYTLNIANIYNLDFYDIINTNVGKLERRQRDVFKS